MRKWHRWVALPAALFMFAIALTGVLLHLDMIRVGQHPPGHEPERPMADTPLPDNQTLAVMVGRVADAARQQPSLKVRTLQINLQGEHIVLTAGPGGPPGTPQLKMDGATGRVIKDPPPPADFHAVLQDIHAGYVFGWTGRILSILSGIALLVLTISGFQMWADMRRKGRKKGLWW